MKKLMYWLVKRYANDELIRIDIMEILNRSMCEQYSERTPYENVYNWFYEVLLSTEFILDTVAMDDQIGLKKIKENIDDAFEDYKFNNYKLS